MVKRKPEAPRIKTVEDTTAEPVKIINNIKKWTPRPKSLTERGYRKYMSRTETVEINGTEYTFQSVSPSWYYKNQDDCGIGTSDRDSKKYVDNILKNVVISPAEIKTEGMKYFDKNDDISTVSTLVKEIERFLRG